VAGADAAERDAMIRNVLADSIPVEHLADHVYAAAAMQLHSPASRPARRQAARSGRRRRLSRLRRAPVSSMVSRLAARAPARVFCACSLCGTLWNYVRIKCTIWRLDRRHLLSGDRRRRRR